MEATIAGIRAAAEAGGHELGEVMIEARDGTVQLRCRKCKNGVVGFIGRKNVATFNARETRIKHVNGNVLSLACDGNLSRYRQHNGL